MTAWRRRILAAALWAALANPVTAGAQAFPLASHFVQPVMSFSSDGRYLALGGSVGPALDHCPLPTCTGRVHLWDLQKGTRVFASDATAARVMSIVFTRNSRFVISGHVDGTVRVWTVDSPRLVQQFSCCAGTWARALAVAPDDRTLATGGQNGEIVLWQLAPDLTGPNSVTRGRTLPGHVFGVSSLSFERSGDYLLSSADDQHVRRWNVSTGAGTEFSRAPGLQKAHRGMVKTVAPLADDRAITGSYWEGGTYKDYKSVAPPDAILRLWDTSTGRPLRSYPLTFGIRCCIQVVTGTPTIAFLKASAWDELPRLQIFNVDDGTVVREVAPAMGESFHSVAMHPNASTFLIAIGEGDFLLWDRIAGAMVGRLVSVDEGWAIVAPDGRMEYSEGFRRWPCAHGITAACAGGASVPSTPGLLPAMVRD